MLRIDTPENKLNNITETVQHYQPATTVQQQQLVAIAHQLATMLFPLLASGESTLKIYSLAVI